MTQQATDDRDAKKRRDAAARAKRYRDRKRRHIRLMSCEVKEGQFADALVAVGVLGEWDCEDPDRVRDALKEALHKLHVTRDA